ncbi:MbcA/ParS/Xre antitoxin family protein [Paraburkholderia sp. EG287A]|uniref:MbcA/ParS/Xre antitoxin family protein n=1 Tax=unclassified Paraburkholderia TaxID=2615204 RepID=UPI0034D20F9F
MTQIETLAAQVSGLYAALEESGRRAIETLRQTDAALADGLVGAFESEAGAAAWLASRTTGFGGRSALELLAQGERAQVMHVLDHLRYGLCT